MEVRLPVGDTWSHVTKPKTKPTFEEADPPNGDVKEKASEMKEWTRDKSWLWGDKITEMDRALYGAFFEGGGEVKNSKKVWVSPQRSVRLLRGEEMEILGRKLSKDDEAYSKRAGTSVVRLKAKIIGETRDNVQRM